MSNGNGSDPVVVPYTFRCPCCATVYHCNRAEPFCLHEHPGQWHLHRVDYSDTPCDPCLTWKEPVERFGADSGYDGEVVLMFPAPGLADKPAFRLWRVST